LKGSSRSQRSSSPRHNNTNNIEEVVERWTRQSVSIWLGDGVASTRVSPVTDLLISAIARELGVPKSRAVKLLRSSPGAVEKIVKTLASDLRRLSGASLGPSHGDCRRGSGGGNGGLDQVEKLLTRLRDDASRIREAHVLVKEVMQAFKSSLDYALQQLVGDILRGIQVEQVLALAVVHVEKALQICDMFLNFIEKYVDSTWARLVIRQVVEEERKFYHLLYRNPKLLETYIWNIWVLLRNGVLVVPKSSELYNVCRVCHGSVITETWFRGKEGVHYLVCKLCLHKIRLDEDTVQRARMSRLREYLCTCIAVSSLRAIWLHYLYIHDLDLLHQRADEVFSISVISKAEETRDLLADLVQNFKIVAEMLVALRLVDVVYKNDIKYYVCKVCGSRFRDDVLGWAELSIHVAQHIVSGEYYQKDLENVYFSEEAG